MYKYARHTLKLPMTAAVYIEGISELLSHDREQRFPFGCMQPVLFP